MMIIINVSQPRVFFFSSVISFLLLTSILLVPTEILSKSGTPSIGSLALQAMRIRSWLRENVWSTIVLHLHGRLFCYIYIYQVRRGSPVLLSGRARFASKDDLPFYQPRRGFRFLKFFFSFLFNGIGLGIRVREQKAHREFTL